MSASIDIIIVNYNSKDRLRKNINSILDSDHDDFHIIIVDNASTDDSLMKIPNDNHITVLINDFNVGFGKACNQGAKQSNSKYILFLNPDTIVEKNTIKDAVYFLENNPYVTVLGCKHYDEEGNIRPSCSRFPTFRNSINDIFGLSKVFPKLFTPATLMTDWNHAESRFVDQVMGAFFLIRRINFEKINGFDEQFFVYYEDVDLARQIITKGGSVFYNSEISIFHEGGGTTNKIKDMRLFYSLNSQLKFHKKYFKLSQRIILIVLINVIEFPLRLLQALVKEGWPGVKGVIKGFILLKKAA